jgi:hypothetical protein
MKPFIIVCGSPKVGKSASAAETFQDSLTILTSLTNMHYYAKQLKTKLKAPVERTVDGDKKLVQLRPPKRIKLIDTHSVSVPRESEPYSWDIKPRVTLGSFQSDGTLVEDPDGTEPMPVSMTQTLESTLKSLLTQTLQAQSKGEPLPYEALIIDEWGEVMDRVFAEMPVVIAKSGKEDAFSRFKGMNEWMMPTMSLLQQLRSAGMSVCLTCHDREPDVENGKKGGARAPSASLAHKITAICDGAVQRVLKDAPFGAKNPDGSPAKPKRLWKLTASEKWSVGLRGFDPEDEEKCAEMDLYTILTDYAGFDI